MKNKKRIFTIAGLLLVAIVGATFAYYTSNTSFENVFNAGKYKVTLTEVFESPDNWVPGETVPKTVTAKNDGTVPAAVRISYTEQWLKEIDGVETDITTQVSPNPAIINFANTNDWTLSNGYYYYKYILEPTDETSSFISGVTLDPNLDSVTCTGEGNEKTCEAQNPASGAKYKLTFTIQTVQYDQYQNVWQTNVEMTEKPAPVTILSGTKGNLQPGDVVGIGDTEDFYVLSSDNSENGKTVLIVKYNLLVGQYYYEENNNGDYISEFRNINPSTPGYGLQSADTQGGYDGYSPYGVAAFSDTNYWMDGNQLKNKYNENNTIHFNTNGYRQYFFQSDSPNESVFPYVYDNTLITAPDFNNAGFETPGYSVAYYVELYKSKLIEMGAPSTIEARLLTYDEGHAGAQVLDETYEGSVYPPSIISLPGQDYWTGAALSNNKLVTNFYDAGFYYYDGYNGLMSGVHPVIEIYTSDIN